MRRLLLAVIALGLLTAFAPAPFPRTSRGPRDEMSLRFCQATWEVVDHEYYTRDNVKSKSPWSVSHVRISGSRWTLLERGQERGSYTIAVDGTTKPAQIDWFPLEQPNAATLWRGLIKREGDRVLILYSSPGNRASDFDSVRAGSFLITVRRGG